VYRICNVVFSGLAVFEETGKLIGQRILPLDGLQAGNGAFILLLYMFFCLT